MWKHLLVLCLSTSCHAARQLPKNPEQTLKQVKDHGLKVGVVHNPPWVDLNKGKNPTGIEVQLVQDLAKKLQASIIWKQGSEETLMNDLVDFEIDMIVAGLSDKNPWHKKVAFTKPYTKTIRYKQHKSDKLEKHVIALPPGENAWLMYVEKFLHERKPSINNMIREISGMKGVAP